MVFSSFVFVFAFLPIALVGYYFAALVGRAPAAAWLVACSLAFYGWWDARFVLLLLASILFNFGISRALAHQKGNNRIQNLILGVGISCDLAVLFYYKYLFAALEFFRHQHFATLQISPIILPLGISFFTFTQIGFLADVRQGIARDRSFLNYILFVTFFPHLIAGPILHNREMMPQYADEKTYSFSPQNLAVGLTIFVIGLFKKCVLADPLSSVASAGFGHPNALSTIAAWDVALCYSLQLYFDFSGYSDMAIGLARMFNIRFPLNFNSPFKARNVIEYWQRFHMTLTRFITLYIYTPLSLSIIRRRAANGLDISRNAQSSLGGMIQIIALPTMITMTLAGIWHGAGLQFLIFGLLHGAYITVNHAARLFRKDNRTAKHDTRFSVIWKVFLTYCAVLAAQIFFRAANVGDALAVLGAMVHLGTATGLLPTPAHMVWIGLLFCGLWALPNTQQIMIRYAPALGKIAEGPIPQLRWDEGLGWSAVMALAAAVAIMGMGGSSEFIYFQF